MVPFQFRVAVAGMHRLVQIVLLIQVVFIAKLGQPFMNADQCLIVRIEAGVFCDRIRLRALEVEVCHPSQEKDAGVMYRIKNYAIVMLFVHAPPSTIQTAPFSCSGICAGYVDGPEFGCAARRRDCESGIVFVSKISGWRCQKVGQIGSEVYGT